jgi:ribosome-associated protein YbcJ (S4-like RNA binding protein)
MEREVPIRGQMIRLGQLLKLAAVIDSGAEVKTFLETEGDIVRVAECGLRVISTVPDDP